MYAENRFYYQGLCPVAHSKVQIDFSFELIFVHMVRWRHDCRYNDTQHNDTQHKIRHLVGHYCTVLLSVVVLSVYLKSAIVLLVVMLCVALVTVIKLNVILLSVIILSVINLNITLMSVIILGSILLSVIILHHVK
jgi:hypothetical protein